MSTGDTVNSISNSLSDDWNKLVHYLPQIIGGAVVLIVGLIIAAIIGSVAKKIVRLFEEDKHVSGFLKHWGIHVRASKFVGIFVWWLVFLVFISAAVQVLHIAVLTSTVHSLVNYLPQLFAAAVVAGLTLVAGRVIKSLVVTGLDGAGVKASTVIGTGIYAAVLVFGLTIAVAQLGIDLALLTANITVIVAGFVLAGALAFGLGSREVAGSLLASWSTKGLVKKGQTINVGGVKGKVLAVTNSGVVIDTPNGEQIVSHAKLMK